MRIGEVAAMAEVSVQTIRFYERRGLLRKPKRLPSGYRYYSPDTVKHVRLIKQAQGLGFTLNEIKHLALLREPHLDNATEIRAIAKAKIQSINNRISFLEKMRDELSCLLDACGCGTGHPKCIISK